MKKHPTMRRLVIAAFALSSCAAPIVPRQVPFNEADFAKTRKDGSGSVVGQAFTVLKDGSARFVQFDTVDLAPVNAFTTEVVQRRFVRGENLAPADPRYFKFLRSAKTNENGSFEIRRVPPGEYYVGTQAIWPYTYTSYDADGNSQENSSTESQYIYQRISVRYGETVRIASWNQGH